MDDNRFALAIALVSLFFICLLFFYNGQWNIALYSESEVITSAVYKNYRLILSPASGIALALGAISTLEVLWLVPEKDRERLNHLALWIFLTVLGNSFTAYLISKRPGCTIELGFWIQSVRLTLATIAWYYMLMWVFRTRRFSKMKREEVKTEESEHKVAQPKENVTTTMLVLNTLRSIGCSPQIEQRGNLIHAIFTFQGEKFTIESNDQCYFITIYDTWWHSISIYSDVEDIANLHKTINLVNQYVNCTLVYTTNKEIEEIGVHSKRTILFVKEITEIDEYLKSVLNDFFKAQRLVLTELEKCKVAENKSSFIIGKMKKKWIICALAILFIICEGERNGLRNDNRGGDICPACDSKDVAEIRYGLYDSKNDVWKEEIESGKVVLGGCMVGEDSKRFYCNDCGYKWGALEQNEAR